MDCFASLAMRAVGLMIIPGVRDRARDGGIARGEFQAGAGGLLADGRAVQFLPRRLVGRIFEAAIGFEFRVSLLEFFVRDQDVRAALVEVDAHLVAGPKDRKAAVASGFRPGVEVLPRAYAARLAT